MKYIIKHIDRNNKNNDMILCRCLDDGTAWTILDDNFLIFDNYESASNCYKNIKNLMDKNEYSDIYILPYEQAAFMSSPIGDLTIDSVGLRKAIDEIIRLKKALKDVDDITNATLI